MTTPPTTQPKLRTFKAAFSSPEMERVNEMMRRFDVGWGPEDGACEEATITSRTVLPVEEYQELVSKAFSEMGGKLYDLYEVVR